jgi:uncharacterized protein (TIGR02996 family)
VNEETFLQTLLDDPNDEVTWSALADWLEEDGQSDRAELVRLVRQSRTLPLMKRTKQRTAVEKRIVVLLASGVRPAVPEFTNSIGMRFALIPPGVCRMGSPATESGRNAGEHLHEVEITKPYWLGVYPVTQEQYQTVMTTNPSFFRAGGSGAERVAGLDTSQFPVENLTWHAAVRFCKRLAKAEGGPKAGRGYRLPTEAEWEYACRGGSASTTAFHFGATAHSSQANFDGNGPYGKARKGPYLNRTCPVGSYAPNAFGLYDLCGNVWEWCSDWFDEDYYEETPRKDPKGPKHGNARSMRGGCWDGLAIACRTAYRIGYLPGSGDSYTGFRVALSAGS